MCFELNMSSHGHMVKPQSPVLIKNNWGRMGEVLISLWLGFSQERKATGGKYEIVLCKLGREPAGFEIRAVGIKEKKKKKRSSKASPSWTLCYVSLDWLTCMLFLSLGLVFPCFPTPSSPAVWYRRRPKAT